MPPKITQLSTRAVTHVEQHWNDNRVPIASSKPLVIKSIKNMRSKTNHSSSKSNPMFSLNFNGSPLAISSTFNSFYKVLFNSRSRYLFTIGLTLIFSFRWNLPPISLCTPKHSYSSDCQYKRRPFRNHYEIITLHDVSFHCTCVSKGPRKRQSAKLQFTQRPL